MNTSTYFQFSHFDVVRDILWLNDEPKTFITTSEDQSLMLWSYRADKWTNSYFDLLKTFNYNLNNFTSISNEKKIKSFEDNKPKTFQKPYYSGNMVNEVKTESPFSQQKYFINSIVLHPKYQNTFIGGDNKGNLFVFDIELKKTVKKAVIGNFPINLLNFSQSGTYLAVGFDTGLVLITDYSNDFKLCHKLEDHSIDSSNIKSRKIPNSFLSCNY